MRELFLGVLTVSLTTSLLLLPLLIFSKKFHHRYAAKTLYLLWLLLAVRLALPLPLALPGAPLRVGVPDYVVYTDHGLEPTFPVAEETPTALFEGSGNTTAPVETVTGQVVVVDTATAAYSVRQLSLWTALGWIWAAGAAVFLLWQGGSYLLARRSILRHAVFASEEEEELLERLWTELGLKQRVVLRTSGQVGSPVMLGLFRPVIVLPEGEADLDDQEAILRHELCHLRRGDVAYKTLMLLANALHWFNPKNHTNLHKRSKDRGL